MGFREIPVLGPIFILRKDIGVGGMNNRHPWQLKKIKMLRAALDLMQNSAANIIHLPQK